MPKTKPPIGADDPRAVLKAIWEDAPPLGQARIVHTRPDLLATLRAETSFLVDSAGITERLFCLHQDLREPARCEVCQGGVRWNPRTRSYHATCSAACAAVKTPIGDRKETQKHTDASERLALLATLDRSLFDPVHADAFLRRNCLRRDGNLNGNLSNPRVFAARFGTEELSRVMSDYLLDHSDMPFARYAATLVGSAPPCEVCGRPASFDSYRDGFRRTCSSRCGNNLPAKIEANRQILLSPSDLSLGHRHEQAESREKLARAAHRDTLAREGEFTVIGELPRGPAKQFDHLRYRFSCTTCVSVFESTFSNRRCYRCEPLRYAMEDDLARAFPHHGPETRKRSLLANKRLEIDVYFQAARLGVELDGTYFHSFGADQGAEERAKRYAHEAKQDACEASGIRLLAFFENEWRDKRPLVLSMIAARLGESTRIWARRCVVRPAAPGETRAFLETHHIQGWCQASESWGLYHEDRLVAVMTFGRPRFNTAGDYELLRFCNATGTTVVGGASRLLKAFERGKTGACLVSYANRRFSDGTLYERLGFSRSHVSRPNYYWTKAGSVRHRAGFQKHKLAKILPDFDPGKTEAQNMFDAGYRRLWDHGHIVFKKDI